MQLAGEETIDVEYNMVELVDLAWDSKIHLGSYLNEEPMMGNDVDDWPTQIVKLPQVCEYAQLLSNLIVEHPSRFHL